MFRFGHAETLIPVMTLLGLYSNNVPLLHDNFHLHENRHFRTSKFMPFASNMAFVLYHCPSSDEEYKVQLLVKERPENFPTCGSSVCGFNELKKYYAKYLNCNFTKICDIDLSNLDNKRKHNEL